jgi:hypothetical protein
MQHQRPRVVLRGPDDGDAMVLTMGPHRAHLTRKAARTETGGHWAVGVAWQDPGLDNPPHTHDEVEAFYVLEGPRLSDWTPRRQAHLLLALDGRGRVLQRQNG